MTCISRPMPESESNSWMSSRRQASPLISYSLSPERNIRRVIETSLYSIGRAPSVLSMVSVTSARPSGARPAVPAKITSSILPPRSAFAPCSPSTQAMASTTLDLPEPLGPTTQVMPGSRRNVVVDAKDLNPFAVKVLRCTALRGVDRAAAAAREGWPVSQATADRLPGPGTTRREHESPQRPVDLQYTRKRADKESARGVF